MDNVLAIVLSTPIMKVGIVAPVLPQRGTGVLTVEAKLLHSANNAGTRVPSLANDRFDHFYGEEITIDVRPKRFFQGT
jgi:hypothetical protein